MRILVTGGAGFIGSNFIRLLLGRDEIYNITNLDKLTYAGNIENIKDLRSSKNHTFVKGDICDAALVNEVMSKCDAVINFAAETHVDRSVQNAKEFVMTDVVGTYTLLEAARKHKIKKYVQISTDEIYGSTEKGAFTEDSSIRPSSPYAASKAGADMLALSYFKTYNLPVCIIRSSNNFGPYQHPEKFIPLFITNCLENRKLPLYGDGLNRRDWIYVMDNCRAVLSVLQKGVEGQIYNAAGNNEKTNIYVAKFILNELKKPESLLQFVKDRPAHDRRYALSSDKIRKLGWKPKHRFEEALRETIKWYAENKGWWQKIKSGSFRDYYKSQYGDLQ